MIAYFVYLQPDGSVYIEGRLRNEECSSGHLRQRVHAGGSYIGIEFDEWTTLSSVTVGDDGSVIKSLRSNSDSAAELPLFIRKPI